MSQTNLPTMEHWMQGRYVLYKAGTNRFINWLVQACRQSSDSTTDATASRPQPRDPDSKTKIKPRELVALAINLTNSSYLVPPSVIRLLEEVIDGRQTFAAWYAAQPKTKNLLEKNESHRYFIEVLQRVRDLLSSIVRPEASNTKDSSKSSSKQKASFQDLGSNLSNLFAQLEVEEPSDSPLGTAPQPTSLPLGRQAPAVELEEDEEDETDFRLFCFLQDAKDLRQFIKETWREYNNGDLSALAAANITEAGTGLLRISSNAFVDANPQFRDYDALLDYFSLDMQVIHPRREPPFLYLHPRAGSTIQDSAIDLSDLICPAASYHLRELKKELAEYEKTENGKTVLKGYNCLTYAPLTHTLFDFPRQLVRETIHEVIMWKVGQDLSKGRTDGSQDARRTFGNSEFVEAIVKFYRTNDLPPWLPIAFQIYCDIYEDVMGSQPARLADEYLDRASDIQKSLAEYNEADPGCAMGKVAEKWLKNTAHRDRILRMRLRVDPKVAEIPPQVSVSEGTPLKSLLGLPCCVGTRLFTYKMDFHRAGVDTAGQMLITLCMAHLYTAGRRLGLITTAWHDMDLVISAQKSLEPLAPKSRGTNDAFTCLKDFLLAIGAPATGFANGNVPKPPPLKEVLKKAKRPVITLQFLRCMLDNLESEEKLGVWRQELIMLMLTSLTSKMDDNTPGKKKSSMAAAAQYTPLQLLNTFKKTFIADEPMLNFNWFSFFTEVKQMFVIMQMNVVPEMTHLKKEDTDLAWEVTYQLLLSQVQKSSSPNRPPTHLESACNIMTSMLSKDDTANKHSNAAFRQSSGRIPASDRPKLKKFDIMSVPLSPMEDKLSREDTAFFHLTASSKTVYDSQGSATRFHELQKWQRDMELNIIKQDGLDPATAEARWVPMKFKVSDLAVNMDEHGMINLAEMDIAEAVNRGLIMPVTNEEFLEGIKSSREKLSDAPGGKGLLGRDFD